MSTRKISLYNTLTRSVQAFEPIQPGRINMFVCGPTVYDYSHLGHAKTYTQFDFIAKYLRFAGFEVTYLQNITDVDDKIIRRAADSGCDPVSLARKFEAAYFDDMEKLGNSSVTRYARAHDHIDDIIYQADRLLAQGFAYSIKDGIYFSTESFERYGKLSGRSDVLPEDAVSRVDENPDKRHPGDFCLWKFRKAGEPWWPTAFGDGRPGWHIEDTAITEHYFGPQYDLHGGAIDLIFPHHEAEIAVMEAVSGLSPLVRYWMHTGFLNTGSEKMSKSLGNFNTIRDALGTTSSRAFRYYFLSHHYRRTIDFTQDALTASTNGLERLDSFARSVDPQRQDQELSSLVAEMRDAFFAKLDEDFDTPGALGILFEFIRDQNKRGGAGESVMSFLNEMHQIFGVLDFDIASQARAEDADIEALVAKRQSLREKRNFAEADAIRSQLEEMGIVSEDGADGVRWYRSH
jgi:cysteinyl-tRNA synthetase